ncbi:MAG TPA: hypothetical protein VMV02_03125 [Acidimicrobiales bacterium]|nr:hypothetical protein [Acidimicrobiales bacterium]HVC26161.1 hypothetical protein [Acidimicrobiales bacterium]
MTTSPRRSKHSDAEVPRGGTGTRARRSRRRRVVALLSSIAVAAAGSLVYVFGISASGSAAAGGASRSPEAVVVVRMLTCAGKPVLKPVNFVISCADANSELTATHWTRWTAKEAVGTTRFGLNLCNPYCAASKISYFPKSTVRLSAPVQTKHGRLFSKLVVTYKLHGKARRFPFSWAGIPAFAK